MNLHKRLEELQQKIGGELLFDDTHLTLLSTDASIYQVKPTAVAYPKTTEDVSEIVKFAASNGLSVHSRGTGSGLCGSAVGDGIIIDFTRFMNSLIELNEDEKTFTCQPGYKFGELQAELKGKGLFFPPDPSSGEYATFGGMYGTNASGAHSVKYGNVADYIVDAEVVLGTGEIINIRETACTPVENLPENLKKLASMYEANAELIESSYPDIACNVAGYQLRGLAKNKNLRLGSLFGGSEGTLGITTKLTFRLKDKPACDTLLVVFFDDIVSSAKTVQKIMPMNPAGIEIMDKSLLALARENDPMLRDKIPADIDNLLLIEFDGQTKEECVHSGNIAKELIEKAELSDKVYLAATAEEKEKFWAVRKAAVPILYKLKGAKKILALIEDAAVPIDNLVEYFEQTYALLKKHRVDFVVYGHIAKGLMHTRPLLDLKQENDVQLLRAIADDFYELISSLGGTVSGEHGDGRIRSKYIERTYPEIFKFFKETKSYLDPFNTLNPDIITSSSENQTKENLRYGTDYHSERKMDYSLLWPEDFLTETEKCHGCSKCTTVTTATRMCPIYKFTRREIAAPKAKANILRALISGKIDNKMLFEKGLQIVADQCVNCGNCYKECPSNVNIPKLAMEAKSQYLKRYGAPFHKRLVTSIDAIGKSLRLVPKPLQKVAQAPFVRKLSEPITGVSAARSFPLFPARNLKNRIKLQETGARLKVMYFAGCYARMIKPEVGEATVSVLKKTGIDVILPEQSCCGIPNLSKGMTEEARKLIDKNIEQWGDIIDDVDYILVSCSSCGLSLLKEWEYLRNDEMIQKIKSKLIHVSTLIAKHLPESKSDKYLGRFAYHMPCHMRNQPDPLSSVNLLKALGQDISQLDSNCCGIAGSWGMAKENNELSEKIGSDLINKINSADADIVLTDCPTCTMQIEHMGRENVKHPIEIVDRLID
jgi:FAD/FMN-containing dehydrogenase/Fe-S oxidoreductase